MLSGDDKIEQSAGTLKGWVPEAYLDEITPAPRPTPDAWLIAGDVVWLAPAEEGETKGAVLAEGERVAFCSLTTWPDLTLTYRGAGDYTLSDPVPDGANWMCLAFDWETGAETIEDLVENVREYGADDYTIQVFAWSDGVPDTLRGGRFVLEEPAAG